MHKGFLIDLERAVPSFAFPALRETFVVPVVPRVRTSTRWNARLAACEDDAATCLPCMMVYSRPRVKGVVEVPTANTSSHARGIAT